jgi:hypothetical protein
MGQGVKGLTAALLVNDGLKVLLPSLSHTKHL